MVSGVDGTISALWLTATEGAIQAVHEMPIDDYFKWSIQLIVAITGLIKIWKNGPNNTKRNSRERS